MSKAEGMVTGYLADEIAAGEYALEILRGRKAFTLRVPVKHPVLLQIVEGDVIECGFPEFEGKARITSIAAPHIVKGSLCREVTLVEVRDVIGEAENE